MTISKMQQLIRIKDRFREAHGDVPASARTILDWAIANDLYQVDMAKARQRAAEELADALRGEMVLDNHGNEIRKNLAFETEQGWLWDERDTITRQHFELTVQASRRLAYAEIRAGVLSVNDYMENHPDEPPIQYSLNFAADLADDGIVIPLSSSELEQLIEPPRRAVAKSETAAAPSRRPSPPSDPS